MSDTTLSPIHDCGLPTRMRSAAVHAATTLAWIVAEYIETKRATVYVYAAEITDFSDPAETTGSAMYFVSYYHGCDASDFLTRYAEKYGDSANVRVLTVTVCATVTVAR